MKLLDWKTARRLALALPLALAASACGSDPAGPDDDEIVHKIGAMSVVVGDQTITFDLASVTGGPITLAVGAGEAVSVSLTDLEDDPLPIPDEFELRILPADPAVAAFQRTSALAGTLTGLSAGGTTVEIQLYHLGDMHEEVSFDTGVVVQ